MFLPDGTPDGLKLVDKSNWNGRAIMCARADYQQARGQEEFTRPGVYVLISQSNDVAGRQSLYIGHADHARERLDQHLKGKDDWTHLILFVSRHDALNKAHVHYLEAQLVARARAARRADLTNGNKPNAPFLSPADRATADAFLDDMLLIYPILGVSAFQEQDAPTPPGPGLTKAGTTTTAPDLPTTTMPPGPPPPPGSTRLYLKASGVRAEGEVLADGFIVFAGAIGRVTPRPSIHRHAFLVRMRQELMASGVLVEEAGVLRLTRDQRFSSPSTAGGVLVGGGVNGLVEWRDGDGRTLKSIQEQALEGTNSGI